MNYLTRALFVVSFVGINSAYACGEKFFAEIYTPYEPVKRAPSAFEEPVSYNPFETKECLARSADNQKNIPLHKPQKNPIATMVAVNNVHILEHAVKQ